MTEPDIFTVWKDAAKYTIERDTHDELDEDPFFSYALENIRTLMNRCVGPCERLSWLQISESATMTSSNGFPVRLIAPIKKNFFSDPEFEQSYYIFRDAILCGGQPDIFFEAIGKIELRDMDRIEMQKYRTFMSASTYLYALEKEFFGDFLNQWGDSPFFYNHTTNGWSPWYGGWQELYRYIHAPRFVKMPGGVKLDSLHGIDFPKWDSSVLRLIIKELIAMMISAIPDSKMSPVEKIHFIRWYTAHVIEAYMVLPIDKFVSVVIKIFRGVKSGQLITLLINCLINNLRHCYAMQRILSDVYCKGRPYYDRQWTLDQIEYYTAFAACGDDFTVNFLVELKMHYDDVKLLIFKYFNAGEALGLYPDQYEYDGAMSFAGATTMFLQNYPYLVPNLPRLHANVAYMGQGMTIPDYLQKLDAMVRILVVSDYDYATKVLKYRDFLVSLFIDYDTAVRSVASGFCSIYEAYCAHKYSSELLEKFGESIIHDPNKIDYLDNQSLSMNIAYHGNYCGPGWSAGKYQDSVIDDSVEAIDEFDESCKQHDKSYYLKEDLDEADEIFYNQNIGKSFKRSIAALAVRMVNGKRGTKKTVKKAVRKLEKKALGKAVRMRRPPAVRRNRRRRGGMATTSAPIAIGSVERSRNFFKMSSKGTGNTLTVSGRDVLAVLSTPSSDTGAGSELYAVDIAPSAMGITRLRKFSELYEKWLPIEFKFVFRTSRKTTDSGQIMMYADVDPYDSPLSGIAAINKGEAASGHTSFSIWNNSMATYRPDPKQQSLYCSPNAIKGFEVPAKFRVIVVTPPEANLELGLIEVHWKVKLFKPTIEEISEINPYGMQFASGTGTSSGLLINGGVDISGGYTNKLPFTLNATTGEVTCSKVGSYLAIITTLLTGGYTVGTTKLDFLTAGGAQPIFGYADDMCRANYSNALCTSIQFDVISVGGSLLPFLSSAALTGPFVTRLTLFELHNFDDLGKVKQDPRFLALEDKVDQLSSILARALKVEGTTKSTSGSSTPGRSEAKRGNLNLSSFSLDG
nr:MAG: RNA-dependent RNA polymerase [Astroviridae sp.]